MKPTKKLYDEDAYLTEFTATVLSCEECKQGYCVLLDQTAFFPEEGGQKADKGILSGIPVADVKIKEAFIYHYLPSPLDIGATVEGKIDFPDRYRKMQNHTGEHIVSGIIHALYGFDNVGFHLGDDDVTFDFSGELTREQLNHVEDLANQAIYRSIPITAYYPSAEGLKDLHYRAKLSITEGVRIVTIGDVDSCACCAPHVKNTGEVGIIKLLDFIRYKGGVRIHMLCGGDAVKDYRAKHLVLAKAATLLSAKQHETDVAVQKLLDEKDRLSFSLRALQKELALEKAKALSSDVPFLSLFTEEKDVAFWREFVQIAAEYHGKCVAVFFGNEDEGYAYLIASYQTDLRPLSKEINRTLNGRGGGNEVLIQGTVRTDKSSIESFLDNQVKCFSAAK